MAEDKSSEKTKDVRGQEVPPGALEVTEDKSSEKTKDARGQEVPPEALEVTAGRRNFAVEGNELLGYIGTPEEYQTYANPTHKPLLTAEEAYLYTDLTDDEIEQSRNRKAPEGIELQSNEVPAVGEGDMPGTGTLVPPSGSATMYSTATSMTLDPVTGPEHPSVLTDEEEKAIADAEEEQRADGEVKGSQTVSASGTKAQGAPGATGTASTKKVEAESKGDDSKTAQQKSMAKPGDKASPQRSNS